MRIGQTSFIIFSSKIASSIIGFVATIYFARVLGAEVLGYYALVLTIVRWLKLGGDIGIASAVTKRMSEGSDREKTLSAGLVSVGLLGIITSIGVLIFRSRINAYMGVEAHYFIIVLVIVGLFTSIISSALRGEHLVHLAGLLSPINIGTRSIVQLFLVIAGFELAGMLTGFLAGILVTGLLGIIFLSTTISIPTYNHFRSLFDYAKYSWLGNLKGRSFNDVDILVLGAFVAPSLVGIYSIAWNITGFIGTFGSSIRQSTFPEISQADAADKGDRISNIVSDSIAFTGLLAIPGLFGALVIGDRLLLVYGPEFKQGTAVLGLLIASMLVYDYKNQLTNALNATDNPHLSFRVNAVFIGANFLLNVVLVAFLGWRGAAIATLISTMLGLILSLFYLKRIIVFTIPYRELVKQLFSAIIMAVSVIYARNLINGIETEIYNGIIVFILVCCGAAVYFAILSVISTRFRTIVRDNLPISRYFYENFRRGRENPPNS